MPCVCVVKLRSLGRVSPWRFVSLQASGWVLLGDITKIFPASTRRIQRVADTPASVVVQFTCAPGEVVPFSLLAPVAGHGVRAIGGLAGWRRLGAVCACPDPHTTPVGPDAGAHAHGQVPGGAGVGGSVGARGATDVDVPGTVVCTTADEACACTFA